MDLLSIFYISDFNRVISLSGSLRGAAVRTFQSYPEDTENSKKKKESSETFPVSGNDRTAGLRASLFSSLLKPPPVPENWHSSECRGRKIEIACTDSALEFSPTNFAGRIEANFPGRMILVEKSTRIFASHPEKLSGTLSLAAAPKATRVAPRFINTHNLLEPEATLNFSRSSPPNRRLCIFISE